VEWPDHEQPLQQCSSGGPHLDHVAQIHTRRQEFVKFEPVSSVKSLGSVEAEPDAASRLVGLHHIPYWTMPAYRTDTERPIEAHRWPAVEGPQKITFRRKAVD
jgi:hypothetical protein